MMFLIYLVVIFLLFDGFMANNVVNSLIEKSCKENVETARDKTNYYEFCVASIKENPKSQEVRNMDELIVVATNNAVANVTGVKGIMEKIVKDRKYKTRLSKKLLQECIKIYSDAYKSLTSSLRYFKERNFRKYSDGLIDAISGTVDCELKFNGDNQQISPVKKENDVAYLMLDIPFNFNYNAHIRVR